MSTTTRGPYRNGQRTRAQILDAALDAFASTGFRGTSLREIARQVGVSAPTLLAHFGTKDALLLAVLDAWAERTSRLEPGRQPGLTWFSHYRNLMSYHVAHPGLLRLFVTIAAEGIDPAHPAHDWVVAWYRRLQEEGVRNLKTAVELGEAHAMTAAEMQIEIRSLSAIMDGFALQWLNDTTFDLIAEFADVFDVVMGRWRSAPLGAETQGLH